MFETRVSRFDHGWHLGQERFALAVGDRKRTELALLHLRSAGRHGGEHEWKTPAEHVDDRLGGTFVGHVRHLYARTVLEQLTGKVGKAALAPRAEIEISRLGLGQRRQLLHRARGKR